MRSIRTIAALAASTAFLATGSVVQAQSPFGQSQPYGQSQSAGQQVFGQILQSLLGGQTARTVDSEWSRGSRPLGSQQATFDTRLDAQVRSGALQSRTADRIRSDYDALVQLEARYGQDGRITPQERQDLTSRYSALTNALEQGGYADDVGGYQSVADGRLEFERRVDAAVAARRLTRTDATRLRTDYAALVRTEAVYQRDGLSAREREDIEQRLDSIDSRVGDVSFGGGGGFQQTHSQRLAVIERALPSLNRGEAADRIRVQLEDLMRLDAAYARMTESADERSYLEHRVGELEAQARIRR